jgi:hypothetical protein
VQNGGVSHAVEVLKPDEIRRGIEGYRYFDLDGVADMMDGVIAQMSRHEVSSLSVQEELEHVWDRAYQELLPTDQALADAFEVVYAHTSADFAPPDQPVHGPPPPPPRTMPRVVFDIDPPEWEVELIPTLDGNLIRARHGEAVEPELGVYRVRIDGRPAPGIGFERGMRGTLVVRRGPNGRTARLTFRPERRGDA